MILTDREIRLSLAERLISIDPPPGPSAYSSTSLDLRLDGSLTVFADQEPGLELVVDPTAAG
jgi:deoxycytidine triphosphate deaminase